MKIAKF